jgi:hypothetical protein
VARALDELTRGAGGLIIVKDPQEAALALPRTYGVDDVPLVLTSRRFTADNQFDTTAAYGDVMLTNGTLDAEVSLPAQVVRLRILNAEIERAYDLGFSDGRTFHVIATDGGLVNAPIPVTRLRMFVGERAEILVDLSKDAPGSSLDLQAFNGGQPFGLSPRPASILRMRALRAAGAIPSQYALREAFTLSARAVGGRFGFGLRPRAASILRMRAFRWAGVIASQWALIDALSLTLRADGGPFFLGFGLRPRAASIFLMRAARCFGDIVSQWALIERESLAPLSPTPRASAETAVATERAAEDA